VDDGSICVRWLFDALVTIENFTGVPAESVRSPSATRKIGSLQQLSCLIDRRAGWGIELINQKLLAGVTGVHKWRCAPAIDQARNAV